MGNKFKVSVEFLASTNIEKIAGTMNRNLRNIKAASINLSRSLAANEASFNSLNRAATRATKAMGVAVVAGIGASILAGSKFQESLQELSAITGLQGEGLEKFGEQAIDMGRKFGVSAGAYLDAVKLVASAKPELLESPKLLKAITDEALVLSKAGKFSLQEAARSLTGSMNQFNMEASESARVINVLAAGAKRGSSFVQDTSLALRNAGVSARLAGLSFEETNAAIQILAKKDILGSAAGTQLQAMFLAMASFPDDFNPKVVGMAKALENLDLSGIAEDGEAMEKAFQRRGLKAAASLIELRKEFTKLVPAITGTDIANEQAAINMAAFNEAVKRLGSNIQAILIKAFLKMEPILTKIVDGMQGFFSDIADNMGTIKKFAAVVSIMTALMWAFIIPTKILTFIPIARAFLSMAAAMWTFNVAVLANPITWVVIAIVAAIAALAYVVYKYWDIIKPAMVDVWEEAKAAFGPSLATLWELLKQLWIIAKPILSWIAKVVGTILVHAFLGFLEVIKIVIKYLKFMFKPIAWLLEKIQGVIDKRKELGEMETGGVGGEGIPTLDIPNSSTTLVGPNGGQTLDINMKVDAEGIPTIEDVSSDGDINFDADLGTMLPSFS